MARVTITINKDGSQIVADAEGFIGEGCKAATENLLARVGGAVDTKEKAEMYMTPVDAKTEKY